MFLTKIYAFFSIIVCIFLNNTGAIDFESLRVVEGYPSGFLSDCPGSTKEARIVQSSLKYLSFVFFGNGGFFTAKQNNFNFFQMKELARKMDFRKKTVLYMNGYMDSALHFPFASLMGAGYAKLGYNVLMLEYNWFTIMIYPQASRFLRPVGKRTAEMLANLSIFGLDPSKLEILGLSLGGHGIGFIAKHYRHLTGRNISRITGLDPAGPCFRHLGPEDRVDASDADFVDVIHTNIDGYGMATPLGHIDYYVNGGEFQLNDIPQMPCSNLCSHLKAFSLWISALQHPDHFKAIKCDKVQDARDRNCYVEKPVTNLFGPKVDKNKTGIFYLATMYFYPFYLGENGTKKENDPYLKYMGLINAENIVKM